MTTPIVGVFESERALAEALGLLRHAGTRRCDMWVFSDRPPRGDVPWDGARHRCVKDLREPGEVQLRAALLGALWGSIVTFLISAPAAFLLLEGMWAQLLVAATAWKAGAAVGLYVGVFVGSGRGLQNEMVSHYLAHLACDRLVLVTSAKRTTVTNVRGILLECGVVEVQDVRGTFEPVPRGDWAAPGVR